MSVSNFESTEILANARLVTDPVIREAVNRLGSPLDMIAGYHFGFNTAEGGQANGTGGGKGVCQALVLCTVAVCGGDQADGIDAAAAVELLHNFSHLHDDIMDRDEQRRHRPAAWLVYGDSLAILGGDALIAAAFSHVPCNAAHMLADALAAMCTGQAADLAFENRPAFGPGAVTVAEYLSMASGKTGALYAAAAGLGAHAAGADEPTVAAMHQAGAAVGLAAQLADDINGLYGNPTATGKPVGGDLTTGKKTLPILAALAATPSPVTTELRAILASGRCVEHDVARATQLIAEADGVTITQQYADRALAEALACGHRVSASGPARGQWEALATFIRRRCV